MEEKNYIQVIRQQKGSEKNNKNKDERKNRMKTNLKPNLFNPHSMYTYYKKKWPGIEVVKKNRNMYIRFMNETKLVIFISIAQRNSLYKLLNRSKLREKELNINY